MRATRFYLIYGLLFSWLILVLLAAFTVNGVISWSVGLIYIAYDSFIQCLVVGISSQNLNGFRPEPVFGVFPSIAAVVPARNEKNILEKCLSALFGQTRQLGEIIVVDDGSTDGTIDWMAQRYDMSFVGKIGRSRQYPELFVLCKKHSGKADSLNAGWRFAKSDVVATIDADTVLDQHAVDAMCRAFAQDPLLLAAGGVIHPVCRQSPLAGVFEFYQTFEYMRSFLERYAWMSFHTLVLVSGAFSAFRRDILVQIGGFDVRSSVEDYELIYRMYRHCYKTGLNPNVKVISDARAWTDAPANFEKFLLQRSRWFAGFLETIFSNKDMVANPRYGRFGKYMLILKLIDTLKPVYGLFAIIIFIFYISSGYKPYSGIVYILAGKLIFDIAFHARAFALYHRWQGLDISKSLWVRSFGAILTEPFAFQILRHVSAVFGIIAYLRGYVAWTHQRQAA